MQTITVVTYIVFIASVFMLIWSLKRRRPETKAHYTVIGLSIVVVVLLTSAVINDIVMDYVDANIGLGLVHFGVWAVTAAYILVAAGVSLLKQRLV